MQAARFCPWCTRVWI